MAGDDVFTKCFGNSQKWYEVMKLISHVAWPDFLKLFNQGKKPYPHDVKKQITKTEVKKEDVVQKVRDNIEAKKGLPNQMKGSLPTSSKNKTKTLSLTGGVAAPNPGKHNRILLEWCCSDFSFFGMPSVDSRG